MSSPKVLCAKCGAQGSGPKCAQCGGEIVKVCPACEFRNSPAKSYCDACGADIRLLRPDGTRIDPPTVPRRLNPLPEAPQAPASGTSLPQAGRARQDFEAAAAPVPARPEPELVIDEPAAQEPPRPSRVGELFRVALAATLMAAAACAVTFFLLHLRLSTQPETVVPPLAKRYLDALSSGDYATAYGLLSEDAKASCTIEEFRVLRATTPWTWSNLKLAVVEPQLVVLEYDLAVQGRPVQRDTLTFTREDGRWVRPYNWHALKAAEEAFDHSDPDLALMKAGEAVRIAPLDPMARGYLCESVYYRKLLHRVEPECRPALELAARYPSKLSRRSVLHLHAIVADAYKGLGDRAKEAEAHTTMLGYSDLSPQDRCGVLLSRGDAYAAVGRVPDAAKDFLDASSVCESAEDLDYARKRSQELSQEVK